MLMPRPIAVSAFGEMPMKARNRTICTMIESHATPMARVIVSFGFSSGMADSLSRLRPLIMDSSQLHDLEFLRSPRNCDLDRIPHYFADKSAPDRRRCGY